jgi:hypothetical protein
VKNKEELSKKIEILEGSIAEKENNIMDDQMATIKQQNEKIDVLTYWKRNNNNLRIQS